MSNISLASSTGSRVDSAAKHIVVGRLSADFYSQFLASSQDLLDKKNDYMARRDEICLGIGRPFNPKFGFSHADNKAYVPVLTNVAVLQQNQSTVADFYVRLYDARTIEEVYPCFVCACLRVCPMQANTGAECACWRMRRRNRLRHSRRGSADRTTFRASCFSVAFH